MMATGGYVVAVPNGGNIEYMVNEENCLLYEAEDLEAAVSAIDRISKDKELRIKMSKRKKNSTVKRLEAN